MDKAKAIFKDGWHPEKPGQSFKQQVNGIIGRGNKEEAQVDRHVTPITQLRDPSTFTPPPRRTDASIRPPPPPPSGPRKPIAFHVGTDLYSGAPKPRDPLPPPKWTPNSTGEPQPLQITQRHGEEYARSAAPPQSLPPRLPPRRNTASSTGSADPLSPPPAPARQTPVPAAPSTAMARLASKGVNVPALGISNQDSHNATSTSGSSMDKLTARFQRLTPSSSRGSSPAPASIPPPPAQGTTMEQKKAALKTAHALRNDPTKVSLTDMRSAASTADNFRQRHGDQVVAGAQKAQETNSKYRIGERMGVMNQKYGISEKATGLTARFNGGNGTSSPTTPPQSSSRKTSILPPPVTSLGKTAPPAFGSNGPQLNAATSPLPMAPRPSHQTPVSQVSPVAAKKKPPPPPPPPKKKTMGSPGQGQGQEDAPPPIPFDTRPVF